MKGTALVVLAGYQEGKYTLPNEGFCAIIEELSTCGDDKFIR